MRPAFQGWRVTTLGPIFSDCEYNMFFRVVGGSIRGWGRFIRVFDTPLEELGGLWIHLSECFEIFFGRDYKFLAIDWILYLR